MFICNARALAAACLILISAVPRAEDLPSGTPLTLAQAVQQALARNPGLQGFAFRLRAQEGHALSAGLAPPPELRTEIENVLGTGRTRGVDAAEATFALSQVIELGGKRQGRLDASAAARGLVEVEREAAQLDVLAEVTRRYLHVASDQEQLRLTQQATALSQDTLAATQRRLAVAKAPEVEVRRARVALARARVEEEHAEHELLSSRYKLAAMWGEAEPRFGPVEADLYALPEVEAFDSLMLRLQRNPDFLRYTSEARLRDAEIRLAETRARADLTLSLGVRRLQETRDEAFVAGFALPLFGKARAQGEIAQAQAQRGLSDAEAQAHRIKAQAQLFELYQELKHAITEAEMLRAEVLPEMQAALKDTEYAFQRGRYSYLEWVEAQRELVAVQRALIDAATNAHLHRAEIERLTAEPLAETN